ncbi:hypothetical protein HY496_01380 [Candidatus Woesearchaeota archaeon]|nr:hypothetical protein [Candidatus Woesearchaeota archaeon]
MSGDDVFEVGRKAIYWMIASFIIGMAMIAFVILIVGYQGRLTAVPVEMKAEFVALRFVNNPDCFAYKDPVSQRVLPATVDLAKFTQEQLDSCYDSGEKGSTVFNFKLTLSERKKSLQTQSYYQVDQGFTGFAVMVWDGTTFTRDVLEVYVQESLRLSARERS